MTNSNHNFMLFGYIVTNRKYHYDLRMMLQYLNSNFANPVSVYEMYYEDHEWNMSNTVPEVDSNRKMFYF